MAKYPKGIFGNKILEKLWDMNEDLSEKVISQRADIIQAKLDLAKAKEDINNHKKDIEDLKAGRGNPQAGGN